MGNFLGKNINDVRLEIQAINANVPEIKITIREPFMYQYSDDIAGTVLQQSPMPGTDLTGSITLELVVSRGKENTRITIPNLTGQSYADAAARLGQLKIGFNFVFGEPGGEAAGQNPGTVTAQNPRGGTEIASDQKVTVTVIPPVAAPGETTGLFQYNLPLNPYPLPLTVEAELPNGSRQILASTSHSGGEFSIPYKLPSGSVIILSMIDREIYRKTVKAPVEE
jgi:beta-lactam-binding protein with PASTA domain